MIGCLCLTEIKQVLNQHAEWSAPVTNVIFANDLVSDEREHAHERVTNHCGAQMADVHFLGHVGCRVVNDDTLARDSADTKTRIAGYFVEKPG